ncbi:MAG: hypothetical protein CMJ49_08215 [Planctomycetaceae bacterium]|nr:hypothetical protein [Planctomycetaceae bacterium]
MRPKVLLNFGPHVYDQWVTPQSWARLESFAEPVGRDRTDPYTESQLIEALEGVAGVMSQGSLIAHLPREVLQHADTLRLIGLWSDNMGHELDYEAARERGIKVVDTSNVGSHQPVAEWVLALTLACLRNLGEITRRMIDRTERQAVALNDDFVNGELTGKRVGLVGFGHIGRRLLELLAPFRVDLKVCDPFLAQTVIDEHGIHTADLDDVIQHAEILIIQVPHTPTTGGMIGRRELDLMCKGGILISCCRGPVIQSDALIEKLQRNEIIAGLDVFDPEPIPKDSPIRDLPNAIISPHIAWYAPAAFPRYFDTMVDEFERFFRREPLQFELTPQLYAQRNT